MSRVVCMYSLRVLDGELSIVLGMGTPCPDGYIYIRVGAFVRIYISVGKGLLDWDTMGCCEGKTGHPIGLFRTTRRQIPPISLP